MPAPRRPLMQRAQIEWLVLVLVLGALAIFGGPLGRWVSDPQAFDGWPDPTGQIRPAGPIERLDLGLYDLGLSLAAVRPDPSIVIVAIDDDSIDQIGRWPWPRRITAELIRRIAADRPASIGLDVIFAEPSTDDAPLAEAIRLARPIMAVARETMQDGRYLPLYPLRTIAGDARLAHVAMTYGSDGLVRGLFAREAHLPALAKLLTDPATPLADARAKAGLDSDRSAADLMLARGEWLRETPWLPRAVSHPPAMVSAASVLRGETPADALQGKRVLVGTTSVGVGDVFSTPLIHGRLQASGVELHAVMASALLGSHLVQPVPAGLVAAIGFATLVLVMVFLYRLPPRSSIAVCVSALAATITVVLLALRVGVWLPMASLLVALVLAYPLWSWRRLSAAVAGLRLQTRELRPSTTVFDNLNSDPGTIEPISRRISHLANASAQVQRLNRFLQDGMESLPHPVLVTDPAGMVMYCNLRMIDAFAALPPQQGKSMGDWFAARFGSRLTLDPTGDIRERELGDDLGRQWLVSLNQTGAAEGAGGGGGASGNAGPGNASSGESAARRWLLQLVEITELRAAEREREEALTFLSHDLRSPQASILSMSEGVGGAQADIDRVALSRHARRALELTDQFLSFARAGSKPIELAEYDLADLLTECVDLSWDRARRRGVRLVGENILAEDTDGREDTDAPEALVSIDVGLVRRALLNLIENAIRHCEVGGTVTVSLGHETACWTIAVADEGPGIPPEALGSLFKAFWQRPAGTVGVNVGAAGLGLAMVERTMSRHHGSTSAENRTDRTGARFTIRLPDGSTATMALVTNPHAHPDPRTQPHNGAAGAA